MSFHVAFDRICQDRKWLLPFLSIHHAFGQSFGGGDLCDWLNVYFQQNHIRIATTDGTLLSFTQQSELPHGIAYEQFIRQTGKIPTRNNLHDWFGACVWATFPNSKAMLNAKHLVHLSDNATANGRNRVRDTITVFDENGVVLIVADDEIGTEIGQALPNFDWQTCLVKNRQYWSDYQNDDNKKAKLFVFGHALLEQLINPYKALCGHAVVLRVPLGFFAMDLTEQLAFVDKKLAENLQVFLSDGITPRQLNPLPILGVPHFWQGQDDAFYGDTHVFRTGRRAKIGK